MQEKQKTQLPPPCSTAHNKFGGWGGQAGQARFLEKFNRSEVEGAVPETGARFSVMLSLLLLLTCGKKDQPSKYLFSTAALHRCSGRAPQSSAVLLGRVFAHVLPSAKWHLLAGFLLRGKAAACLNKDICSEEAY